jgi:hypothetical protein
MLLGFPGERAQARSVDGSGPFGLHMIGIPQVKFGLPGTYRFPSPGTPVGVDDQGRIWEGALAPADSQLVARYDPRKHRLIPGLAVTGDPPVFVSPVGTVWALPMKMGSTAVIRGAFGQKATDVKRTTGYRFTGIYGALAFDKRGGAWVAGWQSREGYYLLNGRGPHAPGLPAAVPRGHSALYYAGPRSTHLRDVRAPAPGPLTGVAVAENGDVWAVGPYRVCRGRGGRDHCTPPLLLRYDPRARHFTRYDVPRRGGFQANTIYLQTSMATSPDGSIWLDLQSGRGFRLMRFFHGHFTTYRHWRGDQAPLVDRNGNVWLIKGGHGRNPFEPRHGHPVVLDTRTGRHFTLREHGGSLFQSPNREMWYVWSPQG